MAERVRGCARSTTLFELQGTPFAFSLVGGLPPKAFLLSEKAKGGVEDRT